MPVDLALCMFESVFIDVVVIICLFGDLWEANGHIEFQNGIAERNLFLQSEFLSFYTVAIIGKTRNRPEKSNKRVV